MNYKCPLIVVKDIGVSRKFYEEVLGQKVIMDFGANITFQGDFALQTKATWADFIDKSEKDILIKSDNFELYFEEEDFDVFLLKLKEYKIKYLHNVKEFSWGQRVIRFYDPDYHIIEVGESMLSVIKRFYKNGKTIEEIQKITMFPMEIINNYIK